MTTTQTTKTQTQLAAELVKGLRGIQAVERPSHVRVEVAKTEKQIAFVSGRVLHVPSGLIPEGCDLPRRSGRAVLKLDGDLSAARQLVQDVARVYAAKQAAAAKAKAPAAPAAPAKKASAKKARTRKPTSGTAAARRAARHD